MGFKNKFFLFIYRYFAIAMMGCGIGGAVPVRDGMSTQSGCLKARAHSLKGVAHFKSDLKKRGTTLSYGRQGNRLSQWSLTRAMESSQAHVAYHNTKGHKIMRVPNSRKLELQPLTLAQG